MGRVGSALHNSLIESWHSTLVEFELLRVEHLATKSEARARVATWIDDYSRRRRQSALDMRNLLESQQRQQEIP